MKLATRIAAPALILLAIGMSVAHADNNETGFWDSDFLKGLTRMTVMHKMDSNTDHMVSKDEFMRAQGRLFEMMDKNHDGMIDENEWRSIYPQGD